VLDVEEGRTTLCQTVTASWPNRAGTHAIRGFVSPRAVSNNGYSVSLNASPRALAPGQTSSLTATSNTDVGSTPYYIEIYDDNTGALVIACGSGTSCTASVSQPSPASKNFTAYVASSSSTEPPLNVQASSDPVAVTWLSVALGADPTLVGTGGSSRRLFAVRGELVFLERLIMPRSRRC